MRKYRAGKGDEEELEGSIEPLAVDGSTIVPASTKSIDSDWKREVSSKSVWQSMLKY